MDTFDGRRRRVSTGTNESGTSINSTATAPVTGEQHRFEDLVQAHLDEMASDDAVATLRADESRWIRLLYRRFDDLEEHLYDLHKTLRGPHRDQVIADFVGERDRVVEVLAELGQAVEPDDFSDVEPEAPKPSTPEQGVAQLQLSWTPGQVTAWASGHDAKHESTEQILERLAAIGGGAIGWERRRSIKLPDGSRADAVTAPIRDSIGWLTSLRLATDDTTGASVSWIGELSALSVRLVTQGRMAPLLKKLKRRATDEQKAKEHASFAVRWTPGLIPEETLAGLAEALPGTVAALENRRDARAFTVAVVSDLVDAICTTAAEKLEVPAALSEPNTKAETAEAMLANLDGKVFSAPTRYGSEIASRLDRWARPITNAFNVRLVVTLDPPGDLNDWYLAVHVPNDDGELDPVESALVNSSNSRRKEVQDQLTRLERLFPPLLRPGARRRGEVILSQDEAWQLMSEAGNALVAAGFDVRVPTLSKRKPTPSLRLTAEEADATVVGAQQLANVSWSAVFDDIELTAEEIRELATQARPLVETRGRWVELDKADLAEAAKALADRADQTRLTGADMLRHALGLEGAPLAGGISIGGQGWAADLLRSARDVPDDPPTKPEGFSGELRHYQAEALAWLHFLDRSGLGGCLALDMGLGKTPIMLADIALGRDHGPALVIAPPAVVGNWAAEARRFVPGVSVVVHHGPNRSSLSNLSEQVANNDLVITTYGTAMRDVEALEKIEWGKIVLDEAQAIKNPTSETAVQLRRIEGRTRVALTGTPIENGLGDLWAILDYTNPGLVGGRAQFVSSLSENNTGKGGAAEQALRALNGILVFRRTKAEPIIAEELPDRIDELDHCAMTPEQIGLYQAVLDTLVKETTDDESPHKKGAVLAAITALKQICNHPAAYQKDDDGPLEGRSGKLARLDEILENVFVSGERVLVFTHFATWGEKLAEHLTRRFDLPIACYHGGLGRSTRDKLVKDFQAGTGPGAMVLSLKAGGTGLNLTAASHVVLYDRWWNPAVEDQARDRVWRIGQKNKVVCHRLVCPGTVDERVEEVVAGKRRIANLVLPKSSSVGDLDTGQLQAALGIDTDTLLTDDLEDTLDDSESAA